MAIQSAINQLVATAVGGAFAAKKRSEAKAEQPQKAQPVAPKSEPDVSKMKVGTTGFALDTTEFGETVDFGAIAMRRMSQAVIDKKKQKDSFNNYIANLKNNKRRTK